MIFDDLIIKGWMILLLVLIF